MSAFPPSTLLPWGHDLCSHYPLDTGQVCGGAIVNMLTFCLVGRGNYTDPSNNQSEDFSFKLPTPSTTSEWLLCLYPDVAYANHTDNCLPDCLPATWWIDVACANLDKTKNNLTMVQGFWQLHAKGLPSGMGGGDCTHKTLDALIMMNEQLCRI
jgi:hypothetical protein